MIITTKLILTQETENVMDEIISEILDTVKLKMEEQGAFDRDAYEEFIEETIQDFREYGKLTDEDSDEYIKDELMKIWEDIENEFAEKRKRNE